MEMQETLNGLFIKSDRSSVEYESKFKTILFLECHLPTTITSHHNIEHIVELGITA